MDDAVRDAGIFVAERNAAKAVPTLAEDAEVVKAIASEILYEESCKVCMSRPDEFGVIAHGDGCRAADEDGAGYSFVDDTRAPQSYALLAIASRMEVAAKELAELRVEVALTRKAFIVALNMHRQRIDSSDADVDGYIAHVKRMELDSAMSAAAPSPGEGGEAGR